MPMALPSLGRAIIVPAPQIGNNPGDSPESRPAMQLIKQLRSHGDFLFRWRSVLPMLLFPVALLAAADAGYFETAFGEVAEEIWLIGCLTVSLAGQTMRALTVGFVPAGTSGRNTRAQRAETLNATGMYSVIRHPLYFANFVVLLGFSMATLQWWMPIVAVLAFVVYYERVIIIEEVFLQKKFGRAYAEWAARTPTFFPRWRLWRAPALSFSLRTVLRREYNGFALILITIPVIELVTEVFGEGQSLAVWLRDDPQWVIIAAIGVLVFLVLRTLKRHTRLLTTPGR